MKNLNKYLKFETEKFLDGKQLVFLKGKMMDNENFKGISMTVLVLNDPYKREYWRRIYCKS